MNSEFFTGIKQWEFERQGAIARLPVFYYDNTSLTAIYTAATPKVKALLPHASMQPIELYPGRCLVAFTAFEYRKTDIDPYNEFSIAFLVSFGRPQIPGLTAAWQMLNKRFTAYVWQLPVTTEIARAGGVELYGYPKFLARIDFRRESGWLTCDLAEGDKKILSLRGQELPTSRGRINRFVTYSIMDGISLVANVLVNPLEYGETRNGNAAELILGPEHPIAAALRKIGLSPKPMLYQYSAKTEAILFGGRNLIDS